MRTHSAQAMGFMLVFGATWHCFDRHGGLREFALSLLSLTVVWTASILLHEIGHAAAARAVNLEPIVILVGGGPSLLRREIFGVALDLAWLTGGGLTLIVSRTRQRRLKWRLLATYVGGPLVSLGLLIVGLVVLAARHH